MMSSMSSMSSSGPFDALVVVASHSSVVTPHVQKPIPPNMTATTACLLNEMLHATQLNVLFHEFSELFKPRHVLISGMQRPKTLPNDLEIQHKLVQHRVNRCIGVSSKHTGWKECMGASAASFIQREGTSLTRQTCFLEGPKMEHEGIFAFTKTSPGQDDITDAILGPPVRRTPQSMQMYRETTPSDKAIIDFEDYFFLKHGKVPTDPEIMQTLPQITQAQIKDLRDNRIIYLNAIHYPHRLLDYWHHDIDDIERLRIATQSVIFSNHALIDKYQSDRAGAENDILMLLPPDLREPRFKNMVLMFIHEIMWNIKTSGIFFDSKTVKCKHNPIFSDVLLERIHAHFPGQRVYVLLLGCRVSDDLTLPPCDSPQSSSGKQRTCRFGGKRRNQKRRTNPPKRTKKNVNRRSQRR